MNYQVIADKDKLKEFIEWLPELESNEKYYVSLLARKKYSDGQSKTHDKAQLKRFTANKSRLLDKITQLEVPLGAWKMQGDPAPQITLALYITPNPRCLKTATELMGKRCWDLMKQGQYNIHAEALSCIQKSPSRTCFVDFDIDSKEVNLDQNWLNEAVGEGNYAIVETRGGYHLLIRPEAATNYRKTNFGDKNWYQLIKKQYPVDQSGDQLIPVVGAVQGGFVPKFIVK